MEISCGSIAKYMLNDFYRLKATELTLLLHEGRVFLNKHKPSIGFLGESILRNFLSSCLPSKYNVTSGFIVCNEQISHQCDIIIYDGSSYAPLAKFGDIEVVSSESVVAIIEVKNSIKYDSFRKTLKDFEILGQMSIQNKYVFIYSSVLPKTVESYFYNKSENRDRVEVFDVDAYPKYDHGSFQYLPTAIVSVCSNYVLKQNLVVNDRDMYGYSAYRYLYPVGSGFHSVSCIQLFLGMIMENCSVGDNNCEINDMHELDFESLQVIYNFGLWDC